MEQQWRVPVALNFSSCAWSCCSILVTFRFLSQFCSVKLASHAVVSGDQGSLCRCTKGPNPYLSPKNILTILTRGVVLLLNPFVTVRPLLV